MANETTTEEHNAWTPPFCAMDDNALKCPHCGEESVNVREHETYRDGDTIEAYCSECHATLEVCSLVEITFSDVECPHSDCGLPGSECGGPVPRRSESGAA